MNNRHPRQLKKSKLWGPFWSCQLNSTANSVHLAHFALNRLNWHCCLAGSSKMAPRILIFFSIDMSADYSFELIFIVRWVPQFIGHNKIFLGSVTKYVPQTTLRVLFVAVITCFTNTYLLLLFPSSSVNSVMDFLVNIGISYI